MRIESQSLRSKVARRIFAVFLVCAIIPFTGLLLTSYYQVATFFNERNQQQLRALAKIMGMDLFEKLTLLESGLKIIRSAILVFDGVPSAVVSENRRLNPEDRWKSIFLISSSGRQYRLLGQMEQAPDFSPSDRRALATGKPLLKALSTGPGGTSRIFIGLMMKPEQTESDILIGEIESSYLWEFETARLLPGYVSPCVLDQSGITLTCTSPAFAQFPARVKSTMERGAVGDIEWNEHGRNYLASYWSLPLKFEFQTPDWIIALATSNEGAFASIAELQNSFILGIVVSLGLSILFAIFSIRKRLVPVEQLHEGTRRIAKNDFSFRVNIRSNDEFEDLANSYNAMANQLGRQFHTLTTKADIDRAVLSLLNTDAIVQTVLSRLMDIFPCDAASVLLFDAASKATDHCYIAKNKSANQPESQKGINNSFISSPARPIERFGVSDALLRVETRKGENRLARQVVEAKVPLVLGENEVKLIDVELMGMNAVQSIMAAPLIVKNDVLGILSFYSEAPGHFGAQELDFFRDLTNQVAIAIYNAQLFETVKHQASELEKSNKAKDEFLGIVSHELKTPLNVILGYLGLLHEGMMGDLTEEQNHALDTVSKHSQDLLGMIESIMEATRIESGAVMVESRAVDLVSLFDDLKAQYGVLPHRKAVALYWRYGPDLPMLQTDRSKLMQILQNLIGNAIKFTDEGHIAVSAAYLPEQSLVEFRVEDTGMGIPEESQALIFEMFRQLDSSATREYGGIGLGLYIVKKLAALIGANVSVKSERGHGSIFTVTLPIINEKAVSASAADISPCATRAKTAYPPL